MPPERPKCKSICYRVEKCLLSNESAAECMGPFLNFEQHMEAVRGMLRKKNVSFVARLELKKTRLSTTV